MGQVGEGMQVIPCNFLVTLLFKSQKLRAGKDLSLEQVQSSHFINKEIEVQVRL